MALPSATIATPDRIAPGAWRPAWRRPTPRRVLGALLVVVAGLLALTLVSTVAALRIPTTTGAAAVGRTAIVIADLTRAEPATPAADDHRRLRLTTWYPAVTGTGSAAPYVADLDRVADGLAASGSVEAAAVAGLGLVRDEARNGADWAAGRHPVLLLSPGNATNVGFYAALAEELASHGYVVIGIDHPYQVAAVDLGDTVAVYSGDAPLDQAMIQTQRRLDERVLDVRLVLDRLAAPAELGLPAAALDLDRIGILGHSNGGVTAAMSCADARLDACLNMDGQLAGGPLSAYPDPVAPTKPFLYLTKERDLQPAMTALFQDAEAPMMRVVVPAAAHGDFSDGARFVPRVLPATTADDVLTVTRSTVLTFFDHVFRGAPRTAFGELAAPVDLRVELYPLLAR